MVTNIDDFSEDYLEHHGIKGMHWGIRRYQNPDGSLTPEGANRYGGRKAMKEITNDLNMLRQHRNMQEYQKARSKYREGLEKVKSIEDKAKRKQEKQKIKGEYKSKLDRIQEHDKEVRKNDIEEIKKIAKKSDKYKDYKRIESMTMNELKDNYKAEKARRKVSKIINGGFATYRTFQLATLGIAAAGVASGMVQIPGISTSDVISSALRAAITPATGLAIAMSLGTTVDKRRNNYTYN